MDTEIFCLPAFEDNYIWCLRRGNALAVVDPGDAAPVLRHLADSGNQLCAILITHHHGDHTGGIAELVKRHPVPVFAPAAESIPGTTRALAGGDRITLPVLAVEFEVIDVAGHTRGHLAYYASAGPSQGGISPPVGGSEPNLRAWGANNGRRGSLFCGDTVFGCGCGKLFEGTAAQLHDALTRIATLPAETLLYSAHEYTASGIRFARAVEPGNVAIDLRGEVVARLRGQGLPTVPFTLADELATSPFFRCGEPAVVAAASHRLGRPLASEREVFAALREWRDHF